MRKWLVLFVCLFLVACSSNEVKTADSPEEALQLLQTEKKFVNISGIIASTEVSENEIFYVFEGSNNSNTEWYVAYVQKNEVNHWEVIEAFSIGLPNRADYVNYSGGNTFRAGIRKEGDLIEEGAITVPIPGSEFFVMIELIS